ncbi:hypothetical protein K443DRAFT_678953 [Laccaria amethystina LaAM-08-1]|uniref:Uncharacterized protein n=1 Tax=Laccaria amethystina LaAM-08-1 TaxID=1095629 RepID=A0A0C9XGN8_9AGAR|nr:hypothetical protein K443DRAFT_678953 [Laccaria amethystina LaAM-08-1]
MAIALQARGVNWPSAWMGLGWGAGRCWCAIYDNFVLGYDEGVAIVGVGVVWGFVKTMGHRRLQSTQLDMEQIGWV